MVAFTLLLVVALGPVAVLSQTDANPETNNRIFGDLSSIIGLLPAYMDCYHAPLMCPNYNVSFYLYTKHTTNSPHILNTSHPETLRNAKFLKGRPVKVLIHGYTGHRSYTPNAEIRPVYLKYSNVNVISIDYSPLVPSPCYVSAVKNVPLVANCTAQLIDMLVEYGKVPLKDFHIVGFSLGAQVAGHVANYIKSGKLKRITGLDPALPLFTGPEDQKLDAGDAQFVDVVHTNAGRRGKVEACGNVDFYVNGGTNQPGCELADFNQASSCSHARAPMLFAESIYTSVGFYGYPCPSYLYYFFGLCRQWDGKSRLELMGEYVNKSATGIYFVETNTSPPYAQGNHNQDAATKKASLGGKQVSE